MAKHREDVGVVEIDSVGWAVVSDDTSRPLTEREALTILIAYRALVQSGFPFDTLDIPDTLQG